MAKGPSGKPPSGRSGDQGNTGHLPKPNVYVPRAGEDPSNFGDAGTKGMVVNPIYAGVGEYPRMISDEQWVRAAQKVLEEDGAEQFLVNLLHVLRSTLGCVEWGGTEAPGRN
jgi:hypothetical protein